MRRFAILLLFIACPSTVAAQGVDWPYYGGDQGGMKYSPLNQIDRDNVTELEVLWTWDNGEAWGFQDFDGQMESGDWGYDTFGAAIVMTDIDTALSTRWDAYWRIAPASHSYKVVCETR